MKSRRHTLWMFVGILWMCTPPFLPNPLLDIRGVKTGLIEKDEIWTRDKIYMLVGRVMVKSGVTLTIESGTIIKGKEGEGVNASVLLVARGGKLMAEGTVEKPIIFTSQYDNIKVGEKEGTNLKSHQGGLWGGVIILGHAAVSVPGGQKQIEGIPANIIEGQYGGGSTPVDDDNSGVLRYVSIRHGGALLGANNEINGLTLGGVGSGTIIEHIEIVGNKDDGIEWFGGSVNVSNILVWASQDDGFDIDQAYSGIISNVVYIAGANSDNALEIDGAEADKKGKFTLQKGTFKGSNQDKYMDFRDAAMGTLKELYFFNYSSSSHISLDADGSADGNKKKADNPETSDNFASGELIITGLEFASSFIDGESVDINNLFVDAWSEASFVVGDSRNGDQAKAQAQANQNKFIRNNRVVDVPQQAGAVIDVFTWTYAYGQGALKDF